MGLRRQLSLGFIFIETLKSDFNQKSAWLMLNQKSAWPMLLDSSNRVLD